MVPAMHSARTVPPTPAGGFQGEGIKTIVPHRAFAKLAARLVPDQTPDEVLRAHLRLLPPAAGSGNVVFAVSKP